MSEAAQLLEQLERYADIDPAPACWFETDDGDWDMNDYCEECCRKEMAKHPGAHMSGDGGCWPESDSCRHCETCGKLLGYTLTNYGVRAEIEHFTMHPPEAPLSKEEAFHIARMLAGAADGDETAISIARSAVALIPQ